MRDDYLWDRSGEPDPEIVRMEQLLAAYRESGPRRVHRARWRNAGWLAVAASAVVALFVAGKLMTGARPSDWQVSIEGGERKRLNEGQVVATGAKGAALLEAEFVGELRLDPNSRLKIVKSSADRQQ